MEDTFYRQYSIKTIPDGFLYSDISRHAIVMLIEHIKMSHNGMKRYRLSGMFYVKKNVS